MVVADVAQRALAEVQNDVAQALFVQKRATFIFAKLKALIFSVDALF